MSGSGGDTGYDYQADATTFVAAHGLAGQPLPWFEGFEDIPVAWLAETGGAGDDLRITTVNGCEIEVQAKHALKRGDEFVATFRRLTLGLRESLPLRAVLLVDRHSSGIIRDDLKHDIVRLGDGRTDDLKPITTELLTDLNESPTSVGDIFSRLRIIVVDLDEGSDGVSVAQSLLSRVLPTDQIVDAYDRLGKRYHRKIKRRSRDTVYSCARFLGVGTHSTERSATPALATTRFAAFTRQITSTFYSAALQQRFPIDQAWDRVMLFQPGIQSATPTMQSAIERYHEWSRLTNSSDLTNSMSAEVFTEAHKRTVIIGGPGAGKTTLSRKIAHHFSDERLAVWIRLPAVATMMRDGIPFEAALVTASVDSAALGSSEGRQVLESADILVADGLDECDPSRAIIAEGISRWTAGHPNTLVCVLTRPVGHSPELLPSFVHGELMPLHASAIRRIAQQLFTSRVGNAEGTRVVAEFCRVVEEKAKAASIASRNPLLLSFLVRLFIDGQPLDGSRGSLFERIIELIRKSSPDGRISARPSVDYASLSEAAEIAGWSSIEVPDRPLIELYAVLGRDLGGGLKELRTAEAAITHWVEHGLLERLSAGSHDAIVFVHLSLGEYLAGRHLAKMSPPDFERAVTQFRRHAKWREPLVFSAACGAANKLVETLLRLDEPQNPRSQEAMIAASAIAETESDKVNQASVESLATNLLLRLSSTVPLVAIDAALALVKLAAVAPDFIARSASEQWDHEQEWTRVAARCVAIATQSQNVRIETLIGWLRDFKPLRSVTFGTDVSEWPPETHELQKAGVTSALKRVATELPLKEAEEEVTRFLRGSRISLGVFHAVAAELHSEPYHNWVVSAVDVDHGMMRQMAEQMTEVMAMSDLAERGFMHAVLMACGKDPDSKVSCRSGFRLLGTLLTSMGLWDAIPGDFAAAVTRIDLLAEVLRCWIAGLGLDRGELADEVNCFLNGAGDLLNIPHFEVSLEQQRIELAKPDLRILADAMKYPSYFLGRGAAQVFLLTESPLREDFLDDVLENGEGPTMWLAGFLAQSVWGNEAFNKLLKRVSRSPANGCGFLYEALIAAANPGAQLDAAIQAALVGAAAEDPREAKKAAESLRDCDSSALRSHVPRIRDLFHDWGSRSRVCERCRIPLSGRSCEQCHVVPTDPRKELLYLLFKSGDLSFEELVEFSNHSHSEIAEQATDALLELAQANSQSMHALTTNIAIGDVNPAALNKLLAIPVGKLRVIASDLRNLLNASPVGVRARVVRSLTGGWISTQQAKEAAEHALRDPAPEVRTAAAMVLRELGA